MSELFININCNFILRDQKPKKKQLFISYLNKKTKSDLRKLIHWFKSDK